MTDSKQGGEMEEYEKKTVADCWAEVEGGAYEGREGLRLERIGDEVVVSGWYDGGVNLDVSLRLTVPELLRAAGVVSLPPPPKD